MDLTVTDPFSTGEVTVMRTSLSRMLCVPVETDTTCAGQAAGTPCPDIDNDLCTIAACDGAGNCDQEQSAVQCDVGSSSSCQIGPLCAPKTGACELILAPAGTSCTHDPEEGCDAGECDGSGQCLSCPTCEAFVGGLLSMDTTAPAGVCGAIRDFRCSNAPDLLCNPDNGDADCNFGTCNDPPGICMGGVTPGSVTCSGNGTLCTGTCDEIQTTDLKCGRFGIGGGLSTLPIFSTNDKVKFFARVAAYDDVTDVLTLEHTSPGDLTSVVLPNTEDKQCTQGPRCSEDNNVPCSDDSDCSGTCDNQCFFGSPMPWISAPTSSLCTIPTVADDLDGAAQCGGSDVSLSLAIRSVTHLTGDQVPALDGVQPCPLCTKPCNGGTNHGAPCTADANCDSDDCGATGNRCLGGMNDGASCTRGNTRLNDTLPTSHDCGFFPGVAVIADQIVNVNLTTAGEIVNAIDNHSTGSSKSARVFCGLCRDLAGEGSFCFEGDTDPGCPTATGSPPGPCTTNADCDDGDEYESCSQSNPGALGKAAATRLEVLGRAPGCLGNGVSKSVDLVDTFCAFAPDLEADTPGPGVMTLRGDMTLLP